MPYYCKKYVKGHVYWGIQEAYREDGKVKTRYLMYIGAEKPDISAIEYLELYGTELLFYKWFYDITPASTKAEDLNFLTSYYPERHAVSTPLETLNDAQLVTVEVSKQKPYPSSEDFLDFDPSSIDPSLYELARHYPITVSHYRYFKYNLECWNYVTEAQERGEKALDEALEKFNKNKKFLNRQLFEITHPYIDGNTQRCWKQIRTGCKYPATHPAYFGLNFCGNLESELKRIGLREHDFIGVRFALYCDKTYLMDDTAGKRTIAFYSSGIIQLPQMALWKHETTRKDTGDLVFLDVATEVEATEKTPYRIEHNIRERHRTIIHETGHHVYRTYAALRQQWQDAIGDTGYDLIKSVRRSLFDWRLRSDGKYLDLSNEAFAVSFVDYIHYTLKYPDVSRSGNLINKVNYDHEWITDALKDIRHMIDYSQDLWDKNLKAGSTPSRIRKETFYKEYIEDLERAIRTFNSYRDSYIYSQIRYTFFNNWDTVRWGLDGAPEPLPTYEELSVDIPPEKCIEHCLWQIEDKRDYRGKLKLSNDTIGELIAFVIDREPFAPRYLYKITSYGTTLVDVLWTSTTDYSLYDKKSTQKKALRQILDYLFARMTDRGYVKFNFEKYTGAESVEHGNWWHFSLAPADITEWTKIGHSALKRGFYLRPVYKQDELAAIDKDTLPTIKKRIQKIKTRKHKGSGYTLFSRAFYLEKVKKSTIIAEYRILQYAHAPEKTIIIEVNPHFRNDVWMHINELTIDYFDYNADPSSAEIEIDTYAQKRLAKLIRKHLYEDLYPLSDYSDYKEEE